MGVEIVHEVRFRDERGHMFTVTMDDNGDLLSAGGSPEIKAADLTRDFWDEVVELAGRLDRCLVCADRLESGG